MKKRALSFAAALLFAFSFLAGTVPGALAAEDNALVIPCGYDELSPCKNGYYMAKKDGKVGVLDDTGAVVLPFIYDGDCYSRYENPDYFTATLGGKQGIVDVHGETITPFVFDWIYALYPKAGGGFYVHGTIDNIYVVTDQTGHVLSPEGFSSVFAGIYGDVAVLTRVDHPMPTVSVSYSILYNLKTGETLSSPDCQRIETAEDGERFVVTTWSKWEFNEQGVSTLVKPSECSIIDRNGEVIVPAGTCDSIGASFGGSFAGGLAPALKNGRLMLIDLWSGNVSKELGDGFSDILEQSDGMLVVRRNHLCGVIDASGDVLVPFSYQNIHCDRNIFDAQLPDGQSATFDRGGKLLANGSSSRSQDQNAELLAVGNALYNIRGELLVPAGKYDSISVGEYGFVTAVKNGRYGILGTDGRALYPCELSGVGRTSARSMILFKGDLSSGFKGNLTNALLDISGKLAVGFGKYILYEILPSGFITAGDSDAAGHTGLLSPSGSLIIPCEYDDISELPGGYFVASKGSERRLFDLNGKAVFDGGAYEDYGICENGLTCVKKDGKWGLLKLPGVLYRSPDSPPSDWALPELTAAAERNLIPEDLMFDYRQNVTREEFCRLVTRLIEQKADGAAYDSIPYDSYPFNDVLYKPDILKAYYLGIVEGDGHGFFNPSAPITRQEAAKMLALAANVLGIDTDTADAADYADGASIAEWAAPGVDYVAAAGIMTGMGDGTFAPAAPYTREQAFLTMLRLRSAAAQKSVDTGAYSLTLPSRFTSETTEQDGYFSTSFRLNDAAVGGVTHYTYAGADQIPDRMKNGGISKAFDDFFNGIGMEEYHSSAAQMGGSTNYGDFEMWFGIGDDPDKLKNRIHHFYIASEDSVYDLWLDQDVFTDKEQQAVLESFSVKGSV